MSVLLVEEEESRLTTYRSVGKLLTSGQYADHGIAYVLYVLLLLLAADLGAAGTESCI